ncbi:phage head-tail connector protein [Lacticaseibacillus yichunensis]|uniref:Phage head-tail connector protein n=1 Tax=Lacticaseibacillus yichunensis TaxID=2486015 RepID=A0ABW4CMG4_9LACO|nr:phage head-tail connector protein [Lacticaseibacillus yichunensis]
MTTEEDKTEQISAIQRRVGANDADKPLLSDLFDEALAAVLDYTGRTDAQMNHSLMLGARRLAVVFYNQQADEGETQRVEGGVTRAFEVGIPASIRSSIAPYRLGRSRRLS